LFLNILTGTQLNLNKLKIIQFKFGKLNYFDCDSYGFRATNNPNIERNHENISTPGGSTYQEVAPALARF
jgi:hypothetical protein